MKKIRLGGDSLPYPILKVFLVMKLAFLVVLVSCMQVSAGVFGQNTHLSLKAEDMKFSKMLKLIERKLPYRFVYSTDLVPSDKKVSLDVTDASLDEVMAKILADTDLEFKLISKKLIVIAPKASDIQEVRVKGKVTDSSGMALPGVSVRVVGTNTGTITNGSGEYELSAPGNASLEFSYIGYLSQTVAINNRTEINIKLADNSKGLNEVVVVGFGTQRKANLSGAVATISTKSISNRPVASVQESLQGVSPGLTILNRPGDVGSESNITMTVRGRTNLGSPGPLIIIDGIPVSNREFQSLKPSDIESMSVLKDAASSAIYGSRAANGVILVTTKKGEEGRTSIDLNASYGWQSPTRHFEYLGSYDYATLYNEALSNAGKDPKFTAEQLQYFKDGSRPDEYPNTDWYKEALVKNPALKDVNLGVSGGSKKSQYYLGLGYLGQESLVQNKDLNRYNLRLNASSQVLPILNIGTNISFIKQDRDTKGGELNWVALNRLVPSMVAVHSDGTWGTINGGSADATLAKDNVLRNMAEGGRGYSRDNITQAGLTAKLTPLPGLMIYGQGSLKYNNNMSFAFTNTLPPLINFLTKEEMTSTRVTQNQMVERWSRRQETLIQGYAEYEKQIKAHHFKLMVGASQERNLYRYIAGGRLNFPNNQAGILDLGSSVDLPTENDSYYGTNVPLNRSYEEFWGILSYFGRINYDYKGKYIFEANFRQDYSSRFHPDYRQANFPSLSAAWRMSEEPFLRNATFLDNLKLRASWGILGNESSTPLGNYLDLLKYGAVYSFNGTQVNGAYQDRGVNIEASWENVYMTDFGVDATFLKGKIDVVADYYIKTTKDILVPITVGNTYALKAPTVNQGSTRNKGIELAVTYNDRIGKDFTFSISGNISKINNEILNLGEVNERISDKWIERVGGSVGDFYGLQAIGLFVDDADVANSPKQASATKPGDIKYKDQNGDKIIDANDRVVIGNDVPWFNYGFSITANYKGIDFSILGYGVTNVETYLDNEASYAFFNGAGVKPLHKNRWTKENPDPNADYPRLLLSSDGQHNYNNNNSFWLFDASYFRIRALTLGYTLPEKLTRKASIKNARLYVAANNPFTIMFDDRLTDYDPEIASGRGGYPGIKTWSVGINVKF